jgi:3-methyladenine DNA glycosylase AlkD
MIEEQLFPLIQEKFLTDDKFRAWHLNVLNVLPTTRVLGLRVGDMRKVAKDLVKEDNPLAYVSRFAQTFAKDRNALCYEEVMIWGMMINAVKCTDEERIQLLEDFVPAIDNWAVCEAYRSNCRLKTSICCSIGQIAG